MTSLFKHSGITVLAAAAALAIGAAPAHATDKFAFEANEDGSFGVLDITTATFLSCGNSGLTLAGLAAGTKGSVYGSSYHSIGPISTVYTVNTANGALTPVETNEVNSTVTFSSTTPGKIYAFDFSLNLYQINPLNAVATLKGSTGVSIGNTVGMSSGSPTLYLSNDNSLYKVNLKNGKATLIGTTTDTITAMVKIGTTLYATSKATPPELLTVNPLTAATTQVAPITGFTGTGYVYGLVPAPNVKKLACP